MDYGNNPEMNGIREDGTAIKVLVVDDSLAIRRLLEKLLSDAKYQVVATAENGEAAVNQYTRHKPDITLMDITMPVMTGIEALDRIMKTDPGAKVVMLTAIGADTEVKAAIKAGAKNYIVKPIVEDTIKRIFKVIKELCK